MYPHDSVILIINRRGNKKFTESECFFVFAEVAEVPVSAAEGEDCVLPCSGHEGVNVKYLEWTEVDQRRDLLAYRGGKTLQRYDDYTNRVQLLHPQLQSRDLSVVLNKVTFKDSGMYKCYALYDDRQETSQFIRLRVKEEVSGLEIKAFVKFNSTHKHLTLSLTGAADAQAFVSSSY
uniref:Ig-like domain-containing protein n=1 Tax=Neogobius melanostomus TaxID=47308 RepID=A0A8C6UVS3_9GOBI